jgi:LysR family transcriptional regulator for metE and metH
MVTLKRLRVVEEIARVGSVTAAAQGLRVTQSAVSHALASLEKELGVELFERRNGLMEPTSAGERVARASVRVASEVDALLCEVEAIRTGREGVLRLTTQGYTSYHWLPRVLRRFEADHAGVEVVVVPEHADAPLQAVRSGAADLAIVHSFEAEDGLDARSLGTDEIVLLVGPDHPLAGGSAVSPDDLRGETLLIQSSVQAAELDELRVRGRRTLEMGPTEVVVSAVQAGMGVSVMPRWVVAPHLESGALVALPFSPEGVTRRWSVVYRARQAGNPALQRLVELMACSSEEEGA